jgi:Protein of unknown function (DUF1552)
MKNWTRRDLFAKFGPAAFLIAPAIFGNRKMALGATFPKRLMVNVLGAGVVQDNYWPTGNEASYSFQGKILEPLTTLKSDVSVVKGLQLFPGNRDGHSSGMLCLMTGYESNPASCPNANEKPYGCDYPYGQKWAQQESFDQTIAKKIATAGQRESISLGIIQGDARPNRNTSYSAEGNFIEPFLNPYSAFDNLIRPFLTSVCPTNTATPTPPIDKESILAKSILSNMKQDIADAVRLVSFSADEKQKIEHYQDALRDLETTLISIAPPAGNAPPPNAEACTKANKQASDPKFNVTSENYVKILDFYFEMTALAFELNLTKVLSLAWSMGGSDGIPVTWLNFNGSPIGESHHTLTHGLSDPTNFMQKVTSIDKWRIEKFAQMINRLKSVKEGDGTLLDNSILMCTSELADGRTHSSSNIPMVIAGKGGGLFKQGRYIQVPEGSGHGGLIKSLFQVFEVPTATNFGDSKIHSLNASRFLG